MGLKRAGLKKEMIELEGDPSSNMKTVVSDEEQYLVSLWSGNDGKIGFGVKVLGSPRQGESLEECARRINEFTVRKLRELEGKVK